jgi:general secretion pathway protein G
VFRHQASDIRLRAASKSAARSPKSGARSLGFTLLELVVTATVLLILASAIIPLAKNSLRRDKELELHRDLREMRMAIDAYKAAVDQQKIKAPPSENNGYPETLQALVDGAALTGSPSLKMRFLRRIPIDPFTGKAEWGLRSVNDEPDSTSWGGGSVYDVYSLSPAKGANGIPYKDW